MGEPALLLVDVVEIARPLVVDDVIIRAVSGAELVVQDREVRVDGAELVGLGKKFLLRAVRVRGHEMQHG